jgi:predicted transposase/invertase (TIGR01784 family)
MTATLSPRLDVVFKMLFADARNRRLLVALLNAVLQPPRPIVSVEVANPEIQKDAPDDRGLVLDVLAVHDDKTRTDVEMQADDRGAMGKRALYHWARMFRDGIGRGDDFAELYPCRVVFILAYCELPGTRVHSKFRALEVHDGTMLSDVLEIHTVELPKLADGAAEPEDAQLLDWARFFAAETDEERRRLAMNNRDISEATDALERLSQDPKAQQLARWREDQLRMYRVELTAIEKRGVEHGLEQGREEGLREAVRVLLGSELSAGREAALAAMGATQLTALIDHLRQHRRWPEQ